MLKYLNPFFFIGLIYFFFHVVLKRGHILSVVIALVSTVVITFGSIVGVFFLILRLFT